MITNGLVPWTEREEQQKPITNEAPPRVTLTLIKYLWDLANAMIKATSVRLSLPPSNPTNTSSASLLLRLVSAMVDATTNCKNSIDDKKLAVVDGCITTPLTPEPEQSKRLGCATINFESPIDRRKLVIDAGSFATTLTPEPGQSKHFVGAPDRKYGLLLYVRGVVEVIR